MKRNKGITLIALVITIVVLIILAGVAISLSIGDNGVFNKAKYASEEYKVRANEEQLEIAKGINKIDTLVSSNRAEEVEPLEIELGPYVMGSLIRFTNADLVKLNGLKKYKTLIIQCGGHMGTYISSNIYIDNNLVLTISDNLEHTINLNNNDELKMNFYCYNGLSNGSATVKIKAE